VSDYLVSFARRAKFGERNASRKLAMIALCNAANDAGDAIVMGADEIAEAAELLSSKNAMRLRRELIGLGLIDVVTDEQGRDTAGRGRGAKGIYRINVRRLEALFTGEWDYAAEAAVWRGQKGAVTAPKDSVPSQHPNGDEKGAAKGAVKGAALGAAKGAAAPHTPLTVGEVSNNNSPPLTPPEGESERSFEQVLQALRTAHPDRMPAIDALIDPLLRQRKLFGCPDPVFALGELAKDASKYSADVLADAVERVKTERGFSFKVSDVSAALKSAAAASSMAQRETPAAPPSPATERLRESIRLALGQNLFEAWFAGLQVEDVGSDRVLVSVGDRFIRSYISGNFDTALRQSVGAVFGVDAFEITVRQPEQKP